MPKTILTESKRPGTGQTAIARITPPERGSKDWFDAGHPGLALRVSYGGARTWCHYYRIDGGLIRRKLGAYPALSLDDAREAWGQDRKMLRDGVDPKAAHEQRVAEAAAERATTRTFAQAVGEYHEHYLTGEAGVSGADDVRDRLLRECATWKKRPVASITAQEVGRLLRSVRDAEHVGRHGQVFEGRPVLANRLHANLGTFFKWCCRPDVGAVIESPVANVPRPYRGEEAREVVYTAEQIGALWRAASRLGAHEGAFLRLLLLTGKRKVALAGLRRDEVGGDGWWRPPQQKRRLRKETKHNWPIPLPQAALDVLSKTPQVDDCPYFFEGRHRGKPLSPGRSLQDKVKAASGVADFFPHGVRHTVVTTMKDLRLPTDLIDRYTDHSPKRGTGRSYDHHEAVDELHDAADTWGRYVLLVAHRRVWARVAAHLNAEDATEGDARRQAQRARKREFCGLIQTGGEPWSRWLRGVARPEKGRVVELQRYRR